MGSMLREYETLYILNPELGDDAATSATDRLKGVLGKMGAEILREEALGKKKLSFFVKKHQRGNFQLLHYVGKPGTVEELERTMRNQDEVIRYLTCGFGQVKDVAVRRAEVEKMVREAQARKAEAERRQREEAEAAAQAAVSSRPGPAAEEESPEADAGGDAE